MEFKKVEFKKLNVELEKRADENKFKESERVEAVEFFEAELELEKATLNSEILQQKRAISKTEKAMEAAIYILTPNLERWDGLDAQKRTEEKRLKHLEYVLSTRVIMLKQMV